MQCVRKSLGGDRRLALAVADEFGEAEHQREHARRQAAHRDHQREPARVGVRALTADPSEDRRASNAASAPLRKMARPVRSSWRVSRCIASAACSLHEIDDDSVTET